MSDLGSYAVRSGALRHEAAEWRHRRVGLAAAAELARHGLGQGYRFGPLAATAGVAEQHDAFVAAMVAAFGDAMATFDYLAAALSSAAAGYDGVDATVAADHERLAGRLPR